MLYLRQDCGVECHAFDTEDGISQNYGIQFKGINTERVIVPLHKRNLPREAAQLAKLMTDDVPLETLSRIPKRPDFLT